MLLVFLVINGGPRISVIDYHIFEGDGELIDFYGDKTYGTSFLISLGIFNRGDEPFVPMRYALIIENNPGKRYVSTPVEISPNNRFKTENPILGGKNPAEKVCLRSDKSDQKAMQLDGCFLSVKKTRN